MRVLLIWPNSRNEVLGWGDLGAVAEPLALEYVAAGALAEGHEVRILDLRLHPEDLDGTLEDFRPDVVGVTAFSMHVRTALRILRRVKEQMPNCATVAGGHHATLLPEDFFADQVDYVVCGEGVKPFAAVLRGLATRNRTVQVPGVWSRTGSTWTYGGEVSALDVDSLPAPARSLTAADRQHYFIDWMRPVALLRTSVGCPYRCSFCSLWSIVDGKYLKRQEEQVVGELAGIAEPFVFLVDDEAFIDGRRMTRLAEAIRLAGIRKRFFSYCRIDTLVRERRALEAWRGVGLERLFVGIDAISPKNLSEYNKRVSLAQIETGLAVARDLGLEIFAQFVVNTDFTRREFQQLVRFIEHNDIRYPSFTVLTPLPGTALLQTFDHVVERQASGRPNWDLFDCQNAVVATRLPKDEFRREYRNLYRVFKGSYTQYREANSALPRDLHDGDVGALSQERERAVYR